MYDMKRLNICRSVMLYCADPIEAARMHGTTVDYVKEVLSKEFAFLYGRRRADAVREEKLIKANDEITRLRRRVKELEERPAYQALLDRAGKDAITHNLPTAGQPSEQVLKTPITQVRGLTDKAINILVGNDILTLGELAKERDSKIRALTGMGEKTHYIVRRALANYGITLPV